MIYNRIFNNIFEVFNHIESQKWCVNWYTPPYFTAMRLYDNMYAYVSMPMNPLYRGQNTFFEDSKPTIYRKEWNVAERLEIELQIADFREILNDNPEVKECKRAGMDVNYKGLAQHYGLKTDLFDFTNSAFIAAFFATTDYNEDTGLYTPVHDDSRIGVLYFHTMGGEMNDMFGHKNNIWPIGSEALRRPQEQRGYALEMEEGDNLNSMPNCFAYKFKQSPLISNQIFMQSRFSLLLFPYDPMTNKIHSMVKERIYSEKSLKSLIDRGIVNLSYNEAVEQLNSIGCRLVPTTPYVYNKDEINFINHVYKSKFPDSIID